MLVKVVKVKMVKIIFNFKRKSWKSSLNELQSAKTTR